MAQVTVVIPFYNSDLYIVTAVKSVIDQTYGDWQLILINDGSTDNSKCMITPFLNDSRIKLLEFEENQGQSMALNLGLNHTDTPYFLALDGDDWLYPNSLELLVSEMEKSTEDIGVIGGNINIVWEYKKNKYHSRIVRGRPFYDKYEFLLANQSVWPRFFRTSVLKKVGGWSTNDPWNGRYAEDIRILSKILELYHVHWVNYPLLYHRKHKNNQSNQLDVYGQALEWMIKENLKKWESPYKPIFSTNSDGWKRLIKFDPD